MMWRTPQGLAEPIRHHATPLAIVAYIWPAVVALVYLLPVASAQSAVTIATDGWIGTTWQLALIIGCGLALAGIYLGDRYLPRSLVLEATGASIVGIEMTAFVVALAIHYPWWAWVHLAVLAVGYFWRAVQVGKERGRVVELIAAVRVITEDQRSGGA